MIQYLDKYLLSACMDPGFVYGTGDSSEQRGQDPCPSRASILVEGDGHSTTEITSEEYSV